jgi:hypothetical protein
VSWVIKLRDEIGMGLKVIHAAAAALPPRLWLFLWWSPLTPQGGAYQERSPLRVLI